MKHANFLKRMMSALLAVALAVSLVTPSWAATSSTAATSGSKNGISWEKVDNSAVSAQLPLKNVEENSDADQYAATDMVRVSIVLDGQSALDKGFSTQSFASNSKAVKYRQQLENKQEKMAKTISKKALDGQALDVVWNLTLAANIISANVEYGQIEKIEKVKGVKAVVIETRYEPCVVNDSETADPNMATSSAQIGSNVAWANGYTGAGSKVAIIDTGLDTSHRSMDPTALSYATKNSGVTLMSASDIAKVMDQLNAAKRANVTADDLYVNAKVAFGFNYIDRNLRITHTGDTEGDHGSHVTGIAAANRYIKNADGSFSPALDTVLTQGVAPDAQVFTMKVFGKGGGAYDSDYMAAIEDAIVLGADAINLSLGSGNPGGSHNSDAAYQAILDKLTESDTVVTISAGNSGTWFENTAYGQPYADGVSWATNGTPGSYTNSLCVASVDNAGSTGNYIEFAGTKMFYNDTTEAPIQPMTTLAGEQRFVYVDAVGNPEDFAAVGDELKGAIALCNRGAINFTAKGNNAVAAGAIGTIVVNNEAGTINMSTDGYTAKAPYVSLTLADGLIIKANAEKKEANGVTYYVGTLTVGSGPAVNPAAAGYYTMSSFSSWGIPGSLEMKPEITAPGGGIYSLKDGNDFQNMSGTSMAAPQVAGMAAVVAQYIKANNLTEKTGLTARALAQSLLMSTAQPILEDQGEYGVGYYSILTQGAGLANVGAATSAGSYLLMDKDATKSYADGKIKAELGDDPDRTGTYSFGFTIYNLKDQAANFVLDADFFTQDLYLGRFSDGSTAAFEDSMTALLASDVTWNVDGKLVEVSDPAGMEDCDFNGDGKVNKEDGQALLDYATGVRTEITNAANADFDADGNIDTYDAYLFFKQLGREAVEVPANGSVHVTLTANVKGLDEYDKDSDGTGTYVEGFVYATEISSDEGVRGDSHSIPVLGYYGSWTDPSMFDVGSYVEYAAGTEDRAPYLYDENGLYGNAVGVTYASDPNSTYYFGGNPLLNDESYHPERNSLNANDTVALWNFALIRNAADARFTVSNDKGILAQSELGAANSAWYYTNGASWQRTSLSIRPNWSPAASRMAEGDQGQLALTMAPEYYVDYSAKEAVTNWDALSDGASMTMPFVVDNTAPSLEDLSISLTNNTLNVTASDNRYVAAVVLYNGSGTKLLASAGSKEDIQPGESAQYSLDLTGVNGKKFLVQVYDYAMNVTTYKLQMQIGEEIPMKEMIAFNLDKHTWINFNKGDSIGDANVLAFSDLNFYAATDVDGMIFASTDTGDLYVLDREDPSDMTFVRNMGVVFTDMAYDGTDVYGVTADSQLYKVSRTTGAVTLVGTIGVKTMTLACDRDGNFYCTDFDKGPNANVDNSGKTYRFTLATMDAPTVLGSRKFNVSDVQALEWNPNNGNVYWLRYYHAIVKDWFGTSETRLSQLMEIIPSEEYISFALNADKLKLEDEITCLVIPQTTSGGGDWSTPTDKVDSVSVSPESTTMLRGGKIQLTASVLPWTATDRTVTWSSSNEAVATVNQNGVVTGVGKGTAVITAASKLDATKTASCIVTVENVDVTVKGALQDKDGNPVLFSWNMAKDDSWTADKSLTTTISAVTVAPKDVMYVVDGSDSFNVLKVNMATGETVENYGNAAGVPLWDMQYSEFFSTEEAPVVNGVYGYYYLPAKAPNNITTSAFSFQDELTEVGATYFVGCTTDGTEEYKGNTCENVFLLDDAGNVWNMLVYPKDGSYSAAYGIIPSNLKQLGAKFPGNGDFNFTSMVPGNDGRLYVASYDGTTSQLYRLTYNESTESFVAECIGNVGDEVWPTALYSVTANGSTADSVPADRLTGTAQTQTLDLTKAQANGVNTKAQLKAPVTGSLNAVSAQSITETLPMQAVAEATDSKLTVSADEKTVTVDVIAKDAATNGLFNVGYNAGLTLTNVSFNTQYSSYKDEAGKVTLGYVDLDGVKAGDTVATLTFAVTDPAALDSLSFAVTEVERGDKTVNESETLVADLHTNTEVKDAKEPTCTQPGYTGDTYCADCGKLLQKGQEIAATGHTWGEWKELKAADCENEGLRIHTCTVCGYAETENLNPLGHDWEDEFTVDKEATCTEDGSKSIHCKRCDAVKDSTVIPATGHDTEIVGTKEPTCTEAGYTGDLVCKKCGEIVELGKAIPATGHSFKDGKCTVCGAADPDYKPAQPGVKTGDESNTALWVVMMASAALLAAAVVVLPRRKRSR